MQIAVYSDAIFNQNGALPRKKIGMNISRFAINLGLISILSACSLVRYQPIEPIDTINKNKGYRLEQIVQKSGKDDVFMMIAFSGGGTRAAALGYGVLNALAQEKIGRQSLLDRIDVVFGVSGGSVLAAYFSLYGAETIPNFERKFLKQNFQGAVTDRVFSLANMPRLFSPEFGRGDLLQEQFEKELFGKTTFAELAKKRKGPFAVISATEMNSGVRIDFTQDFFDVMCLNLGDLLIARAVAASSAVPIIFTPITLNNHGGRCHYQPPISLQETAKHYENSHERPYLHLLDGGLTDNLGLRHILDISEMYGDLSRQSSLVENVRHLVIISVNAQNQLKSDIDLSAAVPDTVAMINAVINVPIDHYSKESLRQFHKLVDELNQKPLYNRRGQPVTVHFVSLNLQDLPDSALREKVLNIPTTFKLSAAEINQLKEAAAVLLKQSQEYQQLRRILK